MQQPDRYKRNDDNQIDDRAKKRPVDRSGLAHSTLEPDKLNRTQQGPVKLRHVCIASKAELCSEPDLIDRTADSLTNNKPFQGEGMPT
jgi:hypothetical protein